MRKIDRASRQTRVKCGGAGESRRVDARGPRRDANVSNLCQRSTWALVWTSESLAGDKKSGIEIGLGETSLEMLIGETPLSTKLAGLEAGPSCERHLDKQEGVLE